MPSQDCAFCAPKVPRNQVKLRCVVEAVWQADPRGVRDHIQQHGLNAISDWSAVGNVAHGLVEDSSFDLNDLPCRKTRTLGLFVGGPHIMHVRGFHVEARLVGQRQVPTKTCDGHPQFMF